MEGKNVTDDLEALLEVLPPVLVEAVCQANRTQDLLEIIMDLGRRPEARFLNHEVVLSEQETTADDIAHVVSRVVEFDDDNRAGIERTLHRISAIRNRRDDVVGLTIRVGRAVYGTTDIIQDIIESGESVLLLGRPGVGKTTMLREVARLLAEKKRVVIVDTSNEIGGGGDIPHPAVGRARRMQVPGPSFQHEVMIEAVENHMPEVIVIDEIGRELEALAARTIAERGVQLIGTAHGLSLDNLLSNPTLADLVGGIESVTLSDEEARRRGTQKTVLERRAPPTFEVLIEIQDWQHLAVHHNVARSVDAILRGRPISAEMRYRDEHGEVKVEQASLEPVYLEPETVQPQQGPLTTLRVYGYGIAHNRLRLAAQSLGVPVQMVGGLGDADVLLTLRSHYRKRPRAITDAERRGTPVYVLRANTTLQMEKCLADILGLKPVAEDPLSDAMRETQEAIRQVLNGAKMVELAPQNSYTRRMQHQMAREADLTSLSRGQEPSRRVRIMRR
ncbi:MAG: R3H domain-containing nucleic acid-binding protein [Chloroflexota bacterium]